jgi:hypothetical protein
MLSGGALALSAPAGAATNALILTVDTSAPGASNTVTLPLNGVGLNATINWGDGLTTEQADTTPGNVSYTYTTPGTYTITITGIVPEFGTPSSSTPVADDALTAVTNWDGVGITSLYNAFSGDANLVSVPTDFPTGITDTGYMFSGATSFNQSLNTWDTTAVTDMSGMFDGATAFNDGGVTLVSVPGVGWDTTNVTNMNDMFAGDTAFNEDLGSWDIEQVSDLADALDNTTISTSNFDATLIGWSSETLIPDLTLGAAGLTYDVYGQAAYDALVSTPDTWVIDDSGEVATSTSTSTVTETPLTITTVIGTVGTALTLVTTGGSETGDVSYTAYAGTAEGCVISGDQLTVTSAGTCIVTATDLTDGEYSAATTITFDAASTTTTTTTTTIPAPLTLGFAPKSKSIGSAERRAITNLSAKLEAGATITVTGYAQHNSTLARERANATATLLRADGMTVKVVVSGQVANKVVITTTAQ